MSGYPEDLPRGKGWVQYRCVRWVPVWGPAGGSGWVDPGRGCQRRQERGSRQTQISSGPACVGAGGASVGDSVESIPHKAGVLWLVPNILKASNIRAEEETPGKVWNGAREEQSLVQ